MNRSCFPIIAALLLPLAMCAGCMADTVDEEDVVAEEQLHDEVGAALQEEGEVLPAPASKNDHDPPPNPWVPEDGFEDAQRNDGDPAPFQQEKKYQIKIPR